MATPARAAQPADAALSAPAQEAAPSAPPERHMPLREWCGTVHHQRGLETIGAFHDAMTKAMTFFDSPDGWETRYQAWAASV